MRAKAGLVTAAADALGCQPVTIYRYLERFPKLREIKAEVDERMKDLSEAKLFKLLQNEDGPTVRWYLGKKAWDRGYGDQMKLEHSGQVDGAKKIVVEFRHPEQDETGESDE